MKTTKQVAQEYLDGKVLLHVFPREIRKELLIEAAKITEENYVKSI